MLALQIEPELGAVAEIAAKADGRISGDRAAAVQDVGDAAGWHADIERKSIGTQSACGQLAFQQTARMGGRKCMTSSLVVIGDFDLVGVTLAKFETDTAPLENLQ